MNPGTRLGPFEIVGPLGAGGMGEVYLARDTRLGRDVAVKVLPQGLAGDPERLKRFEKEARSASALNHPNIVTIYEIGGEGGVSYIAMERVEGSTLRELLTGGPLPTKKILSVAAQVAEGLAKAHAAGIVHRDLKPENVMVTPDGFVKILDFGLAKLSGPPEASGEASHSPTVSGGTEPGMVMGTVAYMSPEQAIGRPLDFRSDQFSLGAVLYEMATGRRPFERPTRPETLTAILREEPEPLASAARATPAPLRWIVERCMAKDPDERYASTRDLARDLAQMATHLSSVSAPGPAAEAAPQRRAFARTGLVLLGAAIGLLAAGVALRLRGLGRTEAPPRLTRATFSPGLQEQPAFSPDGKLLAYVTDESGNLDIVVQPLGGGAPIRVAATGADEAQPAWSPDGRSIVYSAFDNVTNVWELPVSDGRAAGSPRRITLGAGQDVDAAVSRDGKYIAFATTRTNGDIWELSLPSGALRQVSSATTLEQYPELSPDGKTLLAQSDPTGQLAIWTLDLSGRFLEQVSPGGAGDSHWSPDGRQVSYVHGRTIRIHALGSVSGVDTGVRTNGGASFSPDGSTLAFSPSDSPGLSLYTIATRAVRRLGAVPGATGDVGDATWSGDASALVAQVQKEMTRELWIVPADGSAPRRLTNGESEDSHPRWSSVNPDEILFLRDHHRLCVVSVSTGRVRELPFQQDGTFFLDYPSWTHDGKRIFFSIHKKSGNIYVIER